MSDLASATINGPSSAAAEVVDYLKRDEIERLADLAASYWRSAAEAAFRDDRVELENLCKRIALVTREGFHLVKMFGADKKAKAA
jgi:hypothetical protein